MISSMPSRVYHIGTGYAQVDDTVGAPNGHDLITTLPISMLPIAESSESSESGLAKSGIWADLIAVPSLPFRQEVVSLDANLTNSNGTSGLLMRWGDAVIKILYEVHEQRENPKLAYLCSCILRELGLNVVVPQQEVLVKAGSDFVKGGAEIKSRITYDGFSMIYLDRANWTEDFGDMLPAIQYIARANLERVRRVMFDHGMDYSGGNLQCMFNRQTGEVMLIDPAELTIIDSKKFTERFLSRLKVKTVLRELSGHEEVHRQRTGDPYYDEWIGSD